jgi:hypothetical protein
LLQGLMTIEWARALVWISLGERDHPFCLHFCNLSCLH